MRASVTNIPDCGAALPARVEVDTAFAAEVAAALVHEVRQPLSAVLLNAELGLRSLRQAVPDISQSAAALARVLRDARRLDEMLDRTRSAYLQAPSGFAPFALTAAIGEAATFASHRLDALEITATTRIADDMAPVWGNWLQIQQVIYNLVVNAADAIEAAGDGPRTLEILAEPADRGVARIIVADTGCGFDLAAEPQMFQRFFTTKPNGAGLGLAICGTILKAHGSALTAIPREPRGAIFSFTLPYAPR